jgi:hypothetical protein
MYCRKLAGFIINDPPLVAAVIHALTAACIAMNAPIVVFAILMTRIKLAISNLSRGLLENCEKSMWKRKTNSINPSRRHFTPLPLGGEI